MIALALKILLKILRITHIQDDGSTRLELPMPHHYVWWRDETARSWAERSDQFLDPWTLRATRESLHFSMDKVPTFSQS